MRKLLFIGKETGHLVRRHKLHILSPLLFSLRLIATLVINMETAVIVSFMYAGI